MNIKPIRNDDDLRAAFKRLELVFQAQDGTQEADEMEILVTLIEAYERKHYPRCHAASWNRSRNDTLSPDAIALG